LKWPVPLTTDCEIGYDWTVPLDIKNFRFRRVRKDGTEVDEKGKPTGTKWPEEIVALFGPKYGYYEEGAATQSDSQEPTPAQEPTQEETPSKPETTPNPVTPQEPPRQSLGRGEVFEFRLKEWGVGTIEKLAQVIVLCRGRGTHPLRVLSPTGEDALWVGSEIYVNDIEFMTRAEVYGLV
jgi:hypothetical protein